MASIGLWYGECFQRDQMISACVPMSYVVFDFANVLWHAANSDHPRCVMIWRSGRSSRWIKTDDSLENWSDGLFRIISFTFVKISIMDFTWFDWVRWTVVRWQLQDLSIRIIRVFRKGAPTWCYTQAAGSKCSNYVFDFTGYKSWQVAS